MRSLSLLVLVAGCAAEPPSTGPACELVALGQIPVVFRAQVPLVQAALNGRDAVAMLDTGSAITVLAPETAARIGVPGSGLRPLGLVGAGGRVTAPPVGLETITLGRFTIHGLLAVTAPLPLPGLDALFGFNLLDQVELDLDGPARRLTLYRHRSCAGMTPAGAGWERLPTETVAHHLRLPIEVNGVTFRATLDTGASTTILTPATATRAGIPPEALAAAPAQRTEALGPDTATLQAVRFTQLRVGTVVVDRPVLRVGALPEATGEALLGGDFLATRRIWLALGRGEVWVAPAAPALR